MQDLAKWLEPVADQIRQLGIPEPIIRWGHPVMMAIVVFVLGSYVGLAGWRGRVVTDVSAAKKSRIDHRKLAPWMFLFMAAGYPGGVLSLINQNQPILESPHFWTGSIVLLLLLINGAIAFSGFGGKASWRTLHAYLGSTALCLLFVHAVLGLKLGLAL